jgi:hypothetical protein
MSSAERVRSRPAPEVDPDPEGVTVDAALDAWRRMASDITLAAVTAAYLPAIVLGVLGYVPEMGTVVITAGTAIYLVLVAAAVLRRIDYRRRLLAALFALYLGLALINLVVPNLPFAQISAVTTPVYTLVLLGPRAARGAILASAAIIVVLTMSFFMTSRDTAVPSNV